MHFTPIMHLLYLNKGIGISRLVYFDHCPHPDKITKRIKKIKYTSWIKIQRYSNGVPIYGWRLTLPTNTISKLEKWNPTISNPFPHSMPFQTSQSAPDLATNFL